MDEHTEKPLKRAELEDDEDLALGYSVLRALAENSGDMVELAPGVWHVEKRDSHRGYWI
ncbi:hypothetical protein [Actinoplanes sp. M2I2]|uniref:hypothetical protein n=1 Tax=Actinoplanes sp. M2I2 TaxID=1734444 RepID=UPI002021C5D1|nr:hypothetical protein [Actinoplanes sp. M2I2]